VVERHPVIDISDLHDIGDQTGAINKRRRGIHHQKHRPPEQRERGVSKLAAEAAKRAESCLARRRLADGRAIH